MGDKPFTAVAWHLPDLSDMHGDLERLRDYDLGGPRVRELLQGAMDMIYAADVEMRCGK